MTEEEINNKIEARFLDIIKKFPEKLEEVKKIRTLYESGIEKSTRKGNLRFF